MAKDKRGRGAPQLCRDYYGLMYIVVDDDGEPVSDYTTDLHTARDWRDHNLGWQGIRIAEVGFRVVGLDTGEGITIADDPRSEGDG